MSAPFPEEAAHEQHVGGMPPAREVAGDAAAARGGSRGPRRSWRTHGAHGRLWRRQRVASHQEGRGSRGNLSGGETSSTKLATGSAPTRAVETRTSPETECNQCKAPKPEGFLPPPFPPRAVTTAEVALESTGREEVASWTAGSWWNVQRQPWWRQKWLPWRPGHGPRWLWWWKTRWPWGTPGPLDGTDGRTRRGGLGGPGKMAKGEHRQERRDPALLNAETHRAALTTRFIF